MAVAEPVYTLSLTESVYVRAYVAEWQPENADEAERIFGPLKPDEDEDGEAGGARGSLAFLGLLPVKPVKLAADVMTPDPISLGPDASVPDVARALCDNRVHRVLVVEDSQLRGIISSFDLVALLAGNA